MKIFFAALCFVAFAVQAGATPEQIEFFEKKIRPVLAQECYECHSSTGKKKGALVLDSRPGWQEGGQSGELLAPGDAAKSLLIASIRHTDPELKMPKNGAKLDESTIKDFETWINMGAPDPRDKPSSPDEIAKDSDWASVLERRKSWWSFQKIKDATPPDVKNASWSAHPADLFLLARMESESLAPVADADPRTFYRRLSFVLTGLPPKPDEIETFVQDAQKDYSSAVERATDRMLASPRFGERWARHWMDWMRYAETHGSEGDPTIPFAWRYRDYLVRALNADIPYAQLVREHIAGDLLEKPRVNAEQGTNESALGAAQYRLVLHGFTPTDAHDEQVTFIDNQIDTISKSFLGVTVSCARCHNHKFDAISQADFYAFYGVLADCRPATIDLNLPERQRKNVPEMTQAKSDLKNRLADFWMQRADDAVAKLREFKPDPKKYEAPFGAWTRQVAQSADKWAQEWEKQRGEWKEYARKLDDFRKQPAFESWNLAGVDLKAWRSDGPSMRAASAGEFNLEAQGDRLVSGIFPAGIYSHALTSRHRGVLSSPNFKAQGGKLWVRSRGQGKARARYVVRNYPRTGTVYPKHELNSENDEWQQWNLDYWSGDMLHVEITTDLDQPIETSNNERSWFGVSEIRYVKDGNASPPQPQAPLFVMLADDLAAPKSADELAKTYADALRNAIKAWRDGTIGNEQAEFLSAFVRKGWLPNLLKDVSPELRERILAFRKLEAEVPTPVRAPGVLEGFSVDRPLFTRGDHKNPAQVVPRRFMDAIDPTPFETNGLSGRLQLAESIVSPQNPLQARVIVNRAWQYVFGTGLVATPDNFGRLGEAPTHPELLDHLATRFMAEGGSLKKLVRLLVTTRVFRLDSKAPAEALARDPNNRWLARYSVQRLDAEAIRDSMLALSGTLDLNMGGTPVDGGAPRRSVYLKVVRNNLDPMLSAFDYPVPFAPRGKRDVTNVPAQSLTLLNSPRVGGWARDWSRRVLADKTLTSDEQRVSRLMYEAFGRLPRESEIKDCVAYVTQSAPNQKAEESWEQLAQALFNAKEFIYVR